MQERALGRMIRHTVARGLGRRWVADVQREGTLKERFKVFLKKYGVLGFSISTMVSLSTIGGLYTILNAGVDIPKLINNFLDRVDVSEYRLDRSGSLSKGKSSLVVAFALYKLSLPLRYAFVFTITPIIHKRLPPSVIHAIQNVNKVFIR